MRTPLGLMGHTVVRVLSLSAREAKFFTCPAGRRSRHSREEFHLTCLARLFLEASHRVTPDFQLITESEGPLERFKDIRCELLLLGGTKSPQYLQTSVAALAKVFSRARLVTFHGLGHEASGNANHWGKPQQVAQELRRFF